MQDMGDIWTGEPHSPQAPAVNIIRRCYNMDVSVVTQLIGSLGFPIVACGVLFYHNTKIEQQHKQEMDKLADALNNNTLVITKLMERMNGEKRD